MHLRSLRPMSLAIAASVTLFAIACGTLAQTPTPTAPPSSGPAGPRSSEDAGPTPDTDTLPQASTELTAHFQGKTVRFIVGFSPGGGYDTFARMAAPFLTEYLPGSPRVVIENLSGSGGERGLRTAMESAPDGLTVHIIHTRFVKRDILGVEVPGFSLDTVSLVGALGAPTTSAFYVRSSIARSWEEVLALGRPVVTGQTEPGSSGELGSRFVELLGGPIRTTYGYGGTAEIAAAFDRGELDAVNSAGAPSVVPRLFPQWIDQQLLAPVFWWGPSPEEDPYFLDWMRTLNAEVPPHVFEVANATEGQEAVFNLNLTVQESMSRLLVLPPGVPSDILDAWVEAVRRTAEDPRFAEAGKAAGYDTGYTSPAKIREGLAGGRDLLQDPELHQLFEALAGGIE